MILKNVGLRYKLILLAHQAVGHLGNLKTYNKLQREIFWPGMSEDVEK